MKNNWAGEILAIEKSRKVRLDVVNRAMVWAQILEAYGVDFNISLRENKVLIIIKNGKKSLEILFENASWCSYKDKKVYNSLLLNRYYLLPLIKNFMEKSDE